MNISGACHCGAISFEAVADPARVVICHCTDCQAMSGSAYRVNVPVRAETFVLRGEPQRYVKTGSSGAEIVTAFCGTCGAPIYSVKADAPRRINIRLGVVRERAELPPKLQGFCDSAMPWAQDISAVRKVPSAPKS